MTLLLCRVCIRNRKSEFPRPGSSWSCCCCVAIQAIRKMCVPMMSEGRGQAASPTMTVCVVCCVIDAALAPALPCTHSCQASHRQRKGEPWTQEQPFKPQHCSRSAVDARYGKFPSARSRVCEDAAARSSCSWIDCLARVSALRTKVSIVCFRLVALISLTPLSADGLPKRGLSSAT